MRRLVAVILVFALAAAACGSSQDKPTPATSATATVTVPPSPTVSVPTPAPSATLASKAPLGADTRSVLLIGTDAKPGHVAFQTDTIILVTVDVANGRAVMFGIPRNMQNLPLPAGASSAACPGWSTTMLSALFFYSRTHPSCFSGGTGFKAIEDVVSALTGARVDGSISIDLMGFVAVIDKLGGIDIDVPTELRDATYPAPEGTGNIVIDIKPGRQHMDGHTALAYARSRHQDSDYGRMARQQAVLLALRRSVDPASLVAALPSLQKLVVSDVSSGVTAEVLSAATRVTACDVKGFEFIAPAYKSTLDDATVTRIKSVVAGSFDAASASPGASVSPAPGC